MAQFTQWLPTNMEVQLETIEPDILFYGNNETYISCSENGWERNDILVFIHILSYILDQTRESGDAIQGRVLRAIAVFLQTHAWAIDEGGEV